MEFANLQPFKILKRKIPNQILYVGKNTQIIKKSFQSVENLRQVKRLTCDRIFSESLIFNTISNEVDCPPAAEIGVKIGECLL